MLKKLARCIREYKKDTIITPIYIIFEVILECIIPMVIADLVTKIQYGCEMDVVIKYGVILVLMA